ncbi:universal stress protein [uncultured Friedmanniella sp.]|uniref:universal stress protein n=1 Tax=uncultured Friedmanniella sp. TaxID=335381 RepID=UPI0035C9748A
MQRHADHDTVVVGVDGSPEAAEALRYAAAAARSRGLWLLVVHAYELPRHPGTMSTALVLAAAASAADRVAADALSGVRIPAGVPVQTLVERTAPVLMLRRLSERVALLVLGQHSADPSDPRSSGR